jgi:hypothetical protein
MKERFEIWTRRFHTVKKKKEVCSSNCVSRI